MTRAAASRAPRRLEVLDALRGVAAFYIVFHHFGNYYLAPLFPAFPRIFVFGQAAVMAFFLLSGFAVHYASAGAHAGEGFGNYFIRRFRRIYPIYLISIALAFACSAWKAGSLPGIAPRDLAISLLMLQGTHHGSWAGPVFENLPTWSLSFEWWYYMAYFPLAAFLGTRARLRKVAVLAIAIAGMAVHRWHPNPFALFAALFPIWWCGAELADEFLREGRVTFRGQAASLGVLAATTVSWIAVFGLPLSGSSLSHPLLELRQLLTAGALLLAVLAYLRWKPFPLPRGRWLTFAGSISYGVYVFHLPLLYLLPRGSVAAIPGFFFVILPAVIALAWFCERVLQPRVNRRLRAR